MNKKAFFIVLAAEAALPIANKIHREIHAHRVMKARERVRAAWKTGNADAVYEQPMNTFERYLNDLSAFYEKPLPAKQRYEDDAEFKKIIRNF